MNKIPDIFSLFIGLTGIFLSVLFYAKGRKSKRPIYDLRTFNLIKDSINKIDSVKIYYHDKKIDNLSITKVVIWNEGKETINSSDIAQNDPFIINIEEEYLFLNCKILSQKNSANGFSIKKIDSNQIEINFDYFDFREGIIIELHHTATNDKNITIKGSFKGAKCIERNLSPKKIPGFQRYELMDINFSEVPKTVRRVIGYTAFLVPIIFLLFLLQKEQGFSMLDAIFLPLTALPYYWVSYRALKKRVPNGFEIFEDEF